MTFLIDAPHLATGAERTAFLVTAWANTVRAFPELHADWQDGDLTTFPEVKVAISVMAAHGVVTPVVAVPANPDPGFAGRLAAIVREAQHNHVALEHLTASTTGFVELDTATVVAATGLLVRPQSLAVAVASPSPQGLTFTITADHRICDPADLVLVAKRFSAELGR
jgi:pyruvate/2-oxoglutarate dehydrogenase complex dihydrolipoamide acyltransferase (E2) component